MTNLLVAGYFLHDSLGSDVFHEINRVEIGKAGFENNGALPLFVSLVRGWRCL